VVTKFSLERVLRNRKTTVHSVEWAWELSGFGLYITTTNAMKSGALTDFVAEWTPTTLAEEEEGQPTDLPGNADSDDWSCTLMNHSGTSDTEGCDG
jgi:hypothetical protein